jgi:hypothetical protein
MILQKKQLNFKTVVMTLGLFFGTLVADTMLFNSSKFKASQARILGTGTVDLWTSPDGQCTEYKVTVLWIKVHQGNTCD